MNAAPKVLDHDPDVLQAIEDLAPVSATLRRIEQQILDTDETMHWRKYNGLRAAAGQCRDQIRLRAERLVISAPALALLLDEEARLRETYRRKPPRDMLLRALATLVGVSERTLGEAKTAAKVAAIEARTAERAAEAALAAYKAFRGVAA